MILGLARSVFLSLICPIGNPPKKNEIESRRREAIYILLSSFLSFFSFVSHCYHCLKEGESDEQRLAGESFERNLEKLTKKMDTFLQKGSVPSGLSPPFPSAASGSFPDRSAGGRPSKKTEGGKIAARPSFRLKAGSGRLFRAKSTK